MATSGVKTSEPLERFTAAELEMLAGELRPLFACSHSARGQASVARARVHQEQHACRASQCARSPCALNCGGGRG